jgi:hypothetical protein
MAERINKTDDVFGINRNVPLNYVVRESADNFLIDNLTRDKHIVIYGSSKQGKTCLRKHCLNDDDYITIHCSNKWTIVDLNAAILKRAGYEVTQSSAKAVSGKHKIFAKIKASFMGSSAEGGAEAERQETITETTAPLELDPEDVNDIIGALTKLQFAQYIVLEDFHYLPPETQKDFAVALKAFHEASSYCFIIIGVWLEENRLTVYNGDLTGRVVSINADRWTDKELQTVVALGEQLLNIRFDENFKKSVMESCFESVYILQEACYRCCKQYDIHQTQEVNKTIGVGINAKDIIRDVVNQQTGRFNSFITQFADGFQETALQMHRWLLYPVLTSNVDELQKGLRWGHLRQILQDQHPEKTGLNPGNLTQALQSCAALQVKKDIKPIILDYDQTNTRLNVVDRSFLIWLDSQDRRALLQLAGLPIME